MTSDEDIFEACKIFSIAVVTEMLCLVSKFLSSLVVLCSICYQ